MNMKHRGLWGRFSPPPPFRKLLFERKGSAYYELIIQTLVVLTLLMTVVSFLSVFTTYLDLNNMCRRVVRVIELDGQVSDNAYAVLQRLEEQSGLNPEMTVGDVQYFDEDTQRIQLRDTFTVTLTDSYAFTLFKPSFAPPVQILIPLKVSISGMSEKYWKPPL